MKDVLYWEAAEFYEPLYRRGLQKDDGISRECNAIEEILLRNASIMRRVMDAGCGTGIHSVELASRGYELIGFDFSERMVELAIQKPLSKSSRVSFFQGDMRKFVAPKKCDAVICMTNAFLVNNTPEQARTALSCFALSLRRGGVLLLEVTDYLKSMVKGEFAYTYVDRATVGGREVIEVIESTADVDKGVLREHGTYFVSRTDGNYSRHSSDNALALINLSVLEGQLQAAGFTLKEVVDAETRKAATADSTEYFVVAVRS
jgi:2-polyprenyl-3-methyl-5-hydroxy-6-metoxy-1,4-benzoquinol methylase